MINDLLRQLLTHVRVLLDQSDQSITHLEEDCSSILNLLAEGTIRLDGELLAWHGRVWDQIDVMYLKEVVFRIFAEVQWLGSWNREVRIEG